MFDSLNPRSSDSRDREAPGPRGAESLDEPRDVFTRDLHRPRGPEHERVHVREHGQDHHLRGSEIRVADAIARETGRLDCHVLPHRYVHLFPLVGTA
jgi:hypothetical protein